MPSPSEKPAVLAESHDGGAVRVYVNGALTHKILRSKLDEGFVLTDNVRNGHRHGDVASFRRGTESEIAECREKLGDRGR